MSTEVSTVIPEVSSDSEVTTEVSTEDSESSVSLNNGNIPSQVILESIQNSNVVSQIDNSSSRVDGVSQTVVLSVVSRVEEMSSDYSRFL